MGQDTYVDYGVTVSLQLSKTNIQLIKKLMDAKFSPNKYYSSIQCFVTGLMDCNDEIEEIYYDINNEDANNNENTYTKNSIKDLSVHYKQSYINYLANNPDEIMDNIDVTYNFIITCCNAYARNISRRSNSYIFRNDIGVNPMILGRRIKNARKAFLQLGVNKKQILMGHTLLDSQ